MRTTEKSNSVISCHNWSQATDAANVDWQTTCVKIVSAPGRNRTCDQRFRKPLLYPLSYEGGPVPSP